MTYNILVRLLQSGNSQYETKRQHTGPWGKRRNTRNERDDDNQQKITICHSTELFEQVLRDKRQGRVLGSSDEIRRQLSSISTMWCV